jgi:hypothetical protein
MQHQRHTTLMSSSMLAVALWLLSSDNETSTVAQAASTPAERNSMSSSVSVSSDTRIKVALGNNLSSATANIGDAWQGSTTENVTTQNGGAIPAGSQVQGVVVGAISAKWGAHAMLKLDVRSIRVKGHDVSIVASAEPVIARSPRPPTPGAIVGGGVVAALIGEVVLPYGRVMSFTVGEAVSMR